MSDTSNKTLIVAGSELDQRVVSHVVASGPRPSLTLETANSVEQAAAMAIAEHYQAVILHPHDLISHVEAANSLRHDLDKQSIESEKQCQANRRLRDLYETAYRFVDNVSHEFRTPLTVIKEFVAIVRDGLDGPINDQQRDHLDIIAHRVDDLTGIVNEMFELSQLEAGKLAMWRTVCRPKLIIDQVHETMRRQVEKHDATLEVDVDDDLPSIYCDPQKAGRVILQLVDYLLEAAVPAGVVRVRIVPDLDNSQIVFEVSNNGLELDPHTLHTLQARFRQSRGELRTTPKSLGLGLNIAKDLVHLNLGDITVESDVDARTRFRFTVPVADTAKVAVRFLERLRHVKGGDVGASLVSASIDVNTPVDVANDVDQFLQQVVRCDDLVFRLDVNSWLILLAGESMDVDALISRIDRLRNEANRNRPGVSLPEVFLGVRDQWAGGDEVKTLTDEVDTDSKPSSEGPHCILLVDDDRHIVEGAAIRLQTCGFDVHTAYNGEQAIKLAQQHCPDAILLDIDMPVMDGLEALSRLRRQSATRETPIAIMSGVLEDHSRAMRLGANYFIEKPYEPSALVEVVKRMISKSTDYVSSDESPTLKLVRP